jgi:hypothetical protein
MISRLSHLRNQSATVRVVVLTALVLAVFAIVGPAAVVIGGPMALMAAAVAAALCWAGAAIALTTSRFLPGPSLALAALSTGMVARMAIPLAAGLALHLRGGPLAEAGMLYYLLVFYPVTLAVETLLSLPAPQRFQGDRPKPART